MRDCLYRFLGRGKSERNGRELFPVKLLQQLQEFVEGELIYIM